MKFSIRLLYLYLFSFVGLLIVVIGSIQLVNLGIKTYIFPEADTYSSYSPTLAPDGKSAPVIDENKMREQQAADQKHQKQRELANAVAMIIVGAPVYMYHWKTIQKEAKAEK